MKNTEVENFHFWSILVGRAGRSKNGRSHFTHSIDVWKVIMTSAPSLNSIERKLAELAHFQIFSWLAGRAGLRGEVGNEIVIRSTIL